MGRHGLVFAEVVDVMAEPDHGRLLVEREGVRLRPRTGAERLKDSGALTIRLGHEALRFGRGWRHHRKSLLPLFRT